MHEPTQQDRSASEVATSPDTGNSFEIHSLTPDDFATALGASKTRFEDEGNGLTVRHCYHPEYGHVALVDAITGDYYMIVPKLDCADRRDALKVA